MALGLAAQLLGPARADDAASAREAVDKGIKAMGGAEKLAEWKAYSWKGKGTFYGMGAEIPYTGTWTVQWPDKEKYAIDSEFNGQKISFTAVVTADKGWRKFADQTQELDKEQLDEAKQEMHLNYVSSLLPLTEGSAKLSSLGEVMVDKKSAVGIKVSSKGYRDVSLYFDKDTGLLVKSQMRVKDEMAGTEVDQETLYSDYQEYDGVKHPRKVVINRDGKKYIDGTTSDWKRLEKVDDKIFAEP
jgi:hypothetical protein